MIDTLSAKRRSENMRRIRSAGTKPELAVRKLAHGLGYRFRLHRKNLPGKPDLVFAGRRKAIFVHGCYWHQHQECREGRLPGSNTDYWVPKLEKNVARDVQAVADLIERGWEVLVIWECETDDIPTLTVRLRKFLGR